MERLEAQGYIQFLFREEQENNSRYCSIKNIKNKRTYILSEGSYFVFDTVGHMWFDKNLFYFPKGPALAQKALSALNLNLTRPL